MEVVSKFGRPNIAWRQVALPASVAHAKCKSWHPRPSPESALGASWFWEVGISQKCVDHLNVGVSNLKPYHFLIFFQVVVKRGKSWLLNELRSRALQLSAGLVAFEVSGPLSENRVMWVKQCHFYHPWLGMVTIPAVKMLMKCDEWGMMQVQKWHWELPKKTMMEMVWFIEQRCLKIWIPEIPSTKFAILVGVAPSLTPTKAPVILWISC